MESRAKEKESAKANALRITNQFRAKNGMAYDLKHDGARMTLLVSPRTTGADLGDWRVEATAKRPEDADIVLAGWGSTKIEALRALGQSWTSQLANGGMHTFDWDAVAAVLLTVRAV